MANQICKACNVWVRTWNYWGYCKGWPANDRITTTRLGTTLKHILYNLRHQSFTCSRWRAIS